MTRFTATFILFCFAAVAAAQQTLQFSFTHYSTDAGLLTDRTNAVTQDDNGFIWIATADGLQRYDGVRYKTFRHVPGDAGSIPVNGVFQVMRGSKNKLWLLFTDGYAGFFDTRTFRFQQVPLKVNPYKAGFNLAVSKFSQDEKGHIFLLINGEDLNIWDSVHNSFVSATAFFPVKQNWKMVDVVQQPGTEKYYLSIRGMGLVLYNKKTGLISYSGHNTEKDMVVELWGDNSNNPFFRLFIDSKQRFWFMSWPSNLGYPLIHCFDLAAKKTLLERAEMLSSLHEYHTITGFFEQSDGSIWVTGSMLLARFDEPLKKFIPVKNSSSGSYGIRYNEIYFIYEDRQHNIWVPTLSNGLYRFNPSREYFTNILHSNRKGNAESSGNVTSFLELRDGSFLSAVWGDGLYRYNKNQEEIPLRIRGIPDNNEVIIWSMVLSKDSNTVWMGSQPGIFKYNQRTGSAQYYNPESLKGNTVRQITEDRNGNLWIGTHGNGLFKWDAQKGRDDFNAGFEKMAFAGKTIVSKIICDAQNHIWAGTDMDGCYVTDASTGKQLLHLGKDETGANLLPDAGVSSILAYNDSLILLTTQQKMVLYNTVQKGSRIIPLPEQFNAYFSSLEKDKRGLVWMGTSDGLYRYDISTGKLMFFGKKDGIEEPGFGVAASYQAPDGKLFFGAPGKAIMFDPEKINNRKDGIPAVQITEFKLGNQFLLVDSLMERSNIELGYHENVLEISFSAMDHNNGYDVYYMLEGADKEWRLAGKTAMAVYSYLNPGTYIFRVKASNNYGLTGEETILTIVIRPPFWKTWWFYCLLALAAGGLIFWFDRERMKRKAALQQMRTNIAGNLHHEVNTALNNINILSEMARLKADTDPEKSKEFIEQIHSKSHNMIIAMDDMLWSIDPGNDNMEKTLLRMKEYIAALKNRNETAIELLVDDNIHKLNLNMQLRHDAFLLFRESIKQLVLAGAADCRIHIGVEKNHLLYSLQYSNEHCDMQQITNLLQSQEMEKKMGAIHASRQFEVQKSFSLLTVKIPLQQ
ncbi:MAG: two-component regulator propeller domain-containing protein [Ferruginibacter sp.]